MLNSAARSTLDTGGDPNAPFHFQIGSTLTTGSGSRVSLLNGNSVNIFWQVGSSATIGTNSEFVGNVIANQSITMNNGATLEGRLLALNGAVTLDNNVIRPPSAATPSAGGLRQRPRPHPTRRQPQAPLQLPFLPQPRIQRPLRDQPQRRAPLPGRQQRPVQRRPLDRQQRRAQLQARLQLQARRSRQANGGPNRHAWNHSHPGSYRIACAKRDPGPAPSPTASPIVRQLTPNEIILVKELDRLPLNHPLVRQLADLPDDQLPGALILLSPADLTSIFTSGFAVLDVPRNNLELRLNDVRQGTTGFSDSAYRVTETRVHDGKEMLSTDGKEVLSSPEPSAPVDKRWGFFISGTGEIVDIESTSTVQGSSFDTAGVDVGADYRVSDPVALDAALGYSNISADLKLGGSLESNGGHANLYGTYYTRGFYVNASAGGGYGSVETKRRTAGGFARGDTNTTGASATLGTGYDHQLGAFRIGPLASLRYGRIGL